MKFWLVVLILAVCSTNSAASPFILTGDSVLRHDIQVLADAGVITGPVTTWPLAWGPVLEQLREFDDGRAKSAVVSAYRRVNARARWETRSRELLYSAHASLAERPALIRSYENSPRDTKEIGGGLTWVGDRLSAQVQFQFIDADDGGTSSRVDGSAISLALGNYTISLNALDRWWGPGWDGSVILSNNARPIPSISVDRIFTDAFETQWLKWIGPWDFNISLGQLESDRYIPNALFLGMRFNFRPLKSLEIGLSRTAQWCGDGRACNSGTFFDLLVGKDNVGDSEVSRDSEPGNQLAGVDFRWSRLVRDYATGIYGQFVGEDEAGGFPSRYLGQIGADVSGHWNGVWSWRFFAEYAGTACQFHESSKIYNCAYNHGIYQTGYRFKGRSIGHGVDNDARVVSAGLLLVEDDRSQSRLLARSGELNAGGSPDPRNTVTTTPMDLLSLEVSHARHLAYGTVEAGIGYDRVKPADSPARNDTRAYISWRSGY